MRSFLLLLLFVSVCTAQTHPNLILTKEDIKIIKAEWDKYPLFKKTFESVKKDVDKALTRSLDVPIPKDAAAYTHNAHKQNYIDMQLAGIVYQVTMDKKYAEFIRKILLKYAELYPTLGKHPASNNESFGKLFWQSLNETVWLFNTIQAYDCIYDYLSTEDKKLIETNVFRKMVDFFMNEKTRDFNLIHNHGTWMVASVGMTGYVLNDKEMVEKALHGSMLDDNTGFLKQLKTLYSPDGYYTEGAYYARYAIQPFYLFAEAINNNQPELKIYQYHDQILKKALYSTLQMTNYNGDFLPFNDAIIGKNNLSPELVYSLNLAFKHYGNDPSLLEIAHKQNLVMLGSAGLSIAKAISTSNSLPVFNYKSMMLRDGPNGDEGGISMLRANESKSLLFMKFTGHGLSHGHYDKLSFMFYDNGKAVIPDYGSARWVNVEPKFGGRYLPENKSFALSTVAHNTLVVDEKSHFDGKISESSKNHSDLHFISLSDPNFQIVSAKENNAYKDVQIQRTMALVKDSKLSSPLVIDVIRVESKDEHTYDLPYYYYGHLMSASVKYSANDKVQKPLGMKNGYQHLWNVAEGNAGNNFQFTFFGEKKYYSITSSTDSTMNVYFTRIGANDPEFNLRNDPGIILRKKDRSFVLASTIEPHGAYNEITENTSGFTGLIEKIKVVKSTNEITVVDIFGKNDLHWLLMINNQDSSDTNTHAVELDGKRYEWTGNYRLVKN